MILVDAGPLVALIHADDNHHERCREIFETLDEPMTSVWPAVTEAMYLLGLPSPVEAPRPKCGPLRPGGSRDGHFDRADVRIRVGGSH